MSAKPDTVAEDMLSVEIDGTEYQARKGAMIIEVTDENGITVPRFCYHKKLPVAANCRMCMVEVEKAPKPLPACATLRKKRSVRSWNFCSLTTRWIARSATRAANVNCRT